jgi:nitroreductase
MLTAGRLGERLYLAATALGLGCCGIGAFYDFEAVELLDLKKESRLLYLVAVGPVKSIKDDA